MLNTEEIEKEIKKIICEKIPEANFQNLVFSKEYRNENERICVYSEGINYIALISERGEVVEKKVMNEIIDVLYFVINKVTFRIALEYAIENREKNKDFRRKLFSKEVELFSLFGEDFKLKKLNEIESIILENPYNDMS